MIEKGDAVEVVGNLRRVVDFLAKADKDTLRILASFFQGDAKGTTDAKKLKKKLIVSNIYRGAVEVAISKKDVWEEKEENFQKVKDYTSGRSEVDNPPFS